MNASFNLFLDNKNVVLDGTIVVGGVKRGPLSCTQTVAALKGQQLSSALLKTALPVLLSECTPGPDPPQTTFVIESAAYRQTLSATLFYRYVLANWFSPSSLPPRLQSGAAAFARPISSGVQVFTSDASEAPVSYPIPKLSGLLQAAGEARYSNDMPLLADTLFAAYVTSTCASAKLVSIDASAALEVAGVAAFLSARSIAQAGGVSTSFCVTMQTYFYFSILLTHRHSAHLFRFVWHVPGRRRGVCQRRSWVRFVLRVRQMITDAR